MLYDYISINICFGPTEVNLTIPSFIKHVKKIHIFWFPVMVGHLKKKMKMKLSLTVLGKGSEKSRDMVPPPPPPPKKHPRVGFDSF